MYASNFSQLKNYSMEIQMLMLQEIYAKAKNQIYFNKAWKYSWELLQLPFLQEQSDRKSVV